MRLQPITGEHDLPDLSAYRRPGQARRPARRVAGAGFWVLLAFGALLLGKAHSHGSVHHHPPAASKAR